MGNKYCFIVAYTDNYLPGFTALKNSIKKYMDVELIAHHGTSVKDTAIERFKIAYDICDKYDAICLMDADMFLTADCTLFFDIASKGFIVTGSNGMLHDNLFKKDWDIDLNSPYVKIHTTVPIFINHENIDWFIDLYNKKDIPGWNDFIFLNALGIERQNKMLCLPPYTFTGIHHWQMKPETSVMKRDNTIISGTEEAVYMVHGKWWYDGWIDHCKITMESYFKDEQIGERGRARTYQAIAILKAEFDKLSD